MITLGGTNRTKFLVVHIYLEEGYSPKIVETRCFGSYEQAELAVKKMVNDEKRRNFMINTGKLSQVRMKATFILRRLVTNIVTTTGGTSTLSRSK